jgi:para-nitrobenzyl esterase
MPFQAQKKTHAMLKRLLPLSLVLFVLGYLVLAFGLPWFFNRPPADLTPAPEVTITSGKITGGWTDEAQTIAVYNGLPFAAPPIGAKRWAPPEAPDTWTNVRDARAFGNECLQYREGIQEFIRAFIAGHGLSGFKQWMAARVVAAAPPPKESEDCLYLNVRTGNLGNAEQQPVMVWIHGGSHQTGAGSDEFYQSNGLPEQGVVLVTINYRLGPFGYLAHPALTEDSGVGSSGNYGLLDQIKALEWVRDNIASFGGDPANVTIFGESAGAQSVSEIMASPLGDGLYHKAILQSGSSTYNRIHLSTPIETTRSAESIGIEFVEPLLDENSPGMGAAALRNIAAEDILARIPEFEELNGYFLPNVDGWALPQMIGQRIRDGAIPDIPILAGYNADEGTLFYDPDGGKPTVLHAGEFPEDHIDRLAALANVYGPGDGARMIELYGISSEETWDKGASDMLGDDIFGVHMRYLAKSNARKAQPTWLYFFSRTPASPRQTLGAFHASELAFVFDSHNPFLEANEDDLALTEKMTAYWSNFAKTGNPNGDGLPEWPAYSEQTDQWLHLAHDVQPLTSVRKDKLDIMEATLERELAQSISLSPVYLTTLDPETLDAEPTPLPTETESLREN